jgi:hypothetical protein
MKARNLEHTLGKGLDPATINIVLERAQKKVQVKCLLRGVHQSRIK